MNQILIDLATLRDTSSPLAMPSVCCSHPLILQAALRYGARKSIPMLIEATCNQVNHEGGYTGMQPHEFANQVMSITNEEGFDTQQLILGGDHLGPNPWRKQSAEHAMDQAERMVVAYAEAGFSKFHLDASMRCADDPDVLDEELIAQRAARLASAIEAVASQKGGTPPIYIIGTEVPPPGGANHVLDSVQPTDAAAAINTIATHRKVFNDSGLSDAFSRVVALVVQPGVEFGDVNVYQYQPDKAKALAAVLQAEPSVCFEAHSTDYQSSESLQQLARDGYRIQKVGPWLSFALREALYALDRIAPFLNEDYAENSLRDAMDTLMVQQPEHWQDHYAGSASELNLKRHYSYSDRIRYYWSAPQSEAAVAHLFACLGEQTIPETLISQFLPTSWRASMTTPLNAKTLVLDRIEQALAHYPVPKAA